MAETPESLRDRAKLIRETASRLSHTIRAGKGPSSAQMSWLELLGKAALALVVLGGIALIAGMACVASYTR